MSIYIGEKTFFPLFLHAFIKNHAENVTKIKTLLAEKDT